MDISSDDYIYPETTIIEGTTSSTSNNTVVQESNNYQTDRGNVIPSKDSISEPKLPEGEKELTMDTIKDMTPAANPTEDVTPSQDISANVNEISSEEEETDADRAMDAFDSLVFHDFHARGPIEVRQSVHNLETINLTQFDLIALRNEYGITYNSDRDGVDYLITSDYLGQIRCYTPSGEVDDKGETIYLNEAGIVENVDPYDNSHEK
jgi:hypothetical protein